MGEHAAQVNSWRPPSVPPADPQIAGCRREARRAPRLGIFASIGFLGGMFGGLLGIGGGSAIAPILLLVGTLRPAQVAGTTLAAVLVISAVGSGAYASLGHLNLQLAWPIALGSILGAVLGALTARHLSMRLMLGLFLVIIPYFAIKEFWPSFPGPTLDTTTLYLGLLGTATGFVSGILGVGAASLVVPSLAGFFLIDHIVAQGVAMSVALVDSITGVATHARARNIDYRVLLRLAPPAVIAAVAGAYLSHHLSDAVLRTVFGVFMVAVWAMMLSRWISYTVAVRGRSSSD